jgi:hypothetical protein
METLILTTSANAKFYARRPKDISIETRTLEATCGHRNSSVCDECFANVLNFVEILGETYYYSNAREIGALYNHFLTQPHIELDKEALEFRLNAIKNATGIDVSKCVYA